MVTRIVNNDFAGDLRNPTDYWGVEDDRVVVQATGGAIYTMAGNDLVDATMSTGQQTAYLGFGNDIFYGGAGASNRDFVIDGDGNDFCDFGGGDDVIQVGAGNDTFIGGSGFDYVSFYYHNYNGFGSLGLNTVGVTFDLAKTTQNLGIFGTDTFRGFEAVTGGAGNDRLYGSSGANEIEGGGGRDLIDGRGGDDEIEGGSGADILIGGTGADVIQSDNLDGARDTIRYLKLAESGVTASTRDEIQFFLHSAGAAGDRIDLRAIDANPFLAGNQNFVFRGAGAFRADVVGEVRIVDAGADLIVQIDADKDNAPEMTILVRGLPALAAYDFIL